MEGLLNVLCSNSLPTEKQQALASLALCPKSRDEAALVIASLPKFSSWLYVQPDDMTTLMLELMVLHGATSREAGLASRDDVHFLMTYVFREPKRHAMELLILVLAPEQYRLDGNHTDILRRLAATLPDQLRGCSRPGMITRLDLLRAILKVFPATKPKALRHWDIFLDCLSLCYQEAVEVFVELRHHATSDQCTLMFCCALILAREKLGRVAHLAHLACCYSSRGDARNAFLELQGVDVLLETDTLVSASIAAVAYFPEHHFSDTQLAACVSWFETCADIDCGLGALVLSRALTPLLLPRCLPRALARLKTEPKCVGLSRLLPVLARDARCAALIVKAGFAHLI